VERDRSARIRFEVRARNDYFDMWMRRTTLPLRVVGVAWTADGTPVALHAVLERGAGSRRR
jgi:hypothetical protein